MDIQTAAERNLWEVDGLCGRGGVGRGSALSGVNPADAGGYEEEDA